MEFNMGSHISAEGDLLTMNVGDIHSLEAGSAARANKNKLPLDLVPVSFWLNQWKDEDTMNLEMFDMLEAVDAWQKGNDEYLLEWLSETQDMAQALPVLEFGAKKYAMWNWAKGMPYSVSLGSLLRHSQAIINGAVVDKESGEDHWSHILCNIMFLCYHTKYFPALDDRPPFYKDC